MRNIAAPSDLPRGRSYLGGFSTADFLMKLVHLKYLHLRRFVTPDKYVA